MKIVLNRDYGGFSLSEEAFTRYLDLKGIPFERVEDSIGTYFYKAGHINDDSQYLNEYDIDRTDPVLVQVVQELGEKANGPYACLQTLDIPDDLEYTIHEYDGIESVHEKHRVWP